MTAFKAITTLEQLDELDSDAMLAGYQAGLNFTATDYTRKDQAYWHGYLNGQVDCKQMPISPEQCELARVIVAKQRAH